ncbi:MAG: branched-chain amino acid ABC transporter permease [Alphaproteobacteria bacterium]
MELSGIAGYLILFVTFAGVYAVLALGLNLQWGFAGQFNFGIAAFFAVGAYTSAIMTTPPSPAHLGGFDMPFLLGLAAAALVSGTLALLIGAITIRLRTDYLAIATIGIAEIVRLFLKNEDWLTGGVRGLSGIPKPFAEIEGGWPTLIYMVIVVVAVLAVYLFLERAIDSPWGRVLRATRENEPGAAAAGKNVDRVRLQAFVIGSAIMGISGGLFAHFFSFISPEAFDPVFATFLVWIMLISGGSGNNRGAVLGALVIWLVWSGSEILTSRLPAEMITQAGAIRVFLVGFLFQVILLLRPEGILPETPGGRRARTGTGHDPARKAE